MNQPLDLSAWPVVSYEMPDQVPDAEAQNHIDAMQAVLAKKEKFVLIFHGVEYPKESKLFYKLYKAWGKETKDQQKEFCLGAVRVEPDEKKRKSLLKMALTFLTSQAVPYPYKVVASFDEAKSQAQRWLAAT